MSWFNYERKKLYGHGTAPSKGDIIHSTMKVGGATTFIVTDVSFESNPPDMFWLIVEEVS